MTFEDIVNKNGRTLKEWEKHRKKVEAQMLSDSLHYRFGAGWMPDFMCYTFVSSDWVIENCELKRKPEPRKNLWGRIKEVW